MDRSVDTQRDPSSPAPLFDMHALPDHSPPSFYRDVAFSQQQEYDPNMYHYDDGDLLRQHRTIPPLTHGHYETFSEHDLYSSSRLTRDSALVPPIETHETQVYAPHTPYVADDTEHAEALAIDQTHPAWNGQDVGVGNPVTSHSQLVEENIQTGIPAWNAEYLHPDFINLDTSVSDAGWNDSEIMDGNHQALSMMTPLSYSNEPLHQEVNAQITPNYHNMSYPDAGYTVPTQAISPVIPGRDDEVPLPYPAPSQGHLGPLSGDAGAVVTTGSSVTTLCPLRDGQGGICRTLLGYHCQDHLASAHGIHNMSGRTPVRCDACNSTVNRESIVRHIREVHLGFPRKKPCEVKDRNAKAHEVAAYKAKRGVKARK